jgi:hypothetical protein
VVLSRGRTVRRHVLKRHGGAAVRPRGSATGQGQHELTNDFRLCVQVHVRHGDLFRQASKSPGLYRGDDPAPLLGFAPRRLGPDSTNRNVDHNLLEVRGANTGANRELNSSTKTSTQ